MASKQSPLQIVGLVLVLGGLVAALIASFFLSGEDHLPGRFYIERQAYWNGGTYYMKFTWLTVLFTLLDVVILPMIIFIGLGHLLRNRDADSPPPLDWDSTQLARRLKAVAFVLIASVLWLAYTGAAVVAPQLLKPAGFFAALLLLFVPIIPGVIIAFIFEALVAPRYVEGQLESMQLVVDKNVSTAHVVVSGETFETHPASVAHLAQGARVGLLISGFFNTVLRIERRG